MKIYKTVKFLGHEYDVSEVSASELQGANGETWLKFCKIKIDKDLPQSRKESVLLHEIIEVINAHFELELEHKAIECLEESLYAVIKENPTIFLDNSEVDIKND